MAELLLPPVARSPPPTVEAQPSVAEPVPVPQTLPSLAQAAMVAAEKTAEATAQRYCLAGELPIQ